LSTIKSNRCSACSPWQNPYAERLIGTLRRESLDHVLIFGARHLRRVLAAHSRYYNQTRTDLSLDKDAALGRSIQQSLLCRFSQKNRK
jgi:transposase InsO family protein